MVNYFSSKLGIVLCIVSFLFVANDFGTRFTSKAIKKNKALRHVNVVNFALPQISLLDVAEIEDKYKDTQEEITSDTKTRSGVMSREYQDNQKGLLQTLFINDNKLELKSIIHSNAKEAVALILVTNIKNGTSELETIPHNSRIYGYRILVEEQTQIQLIKLAINEESQKVEKPSQQIILSMYKPK